MRLSLTATHGTLLEPDELSPVGFGCYRLSTRAGAAALALALRSGCNLLDTAATYTAGESECVAGAVLTAHPELRTFVITKAGYGDEDGSPHCLEPSFLQARIERSAQRLQRPVVDALLLHNPERMLAQGVPPDELGPRLEEAFAFLEGCVGANRLRFYGVSSNVLATPPLRCLSLEGYLDVARQTEERHHFRFIQFPCNLLERTAIERTTDGPSLAARAKANGVLTLANRPLNALRGDRLVRLTTYAGDDGEAVDSDDTLLARCLVVLGRRLVEVGSELEPLDIDVVRYVAEHFADLDTTDAVETLFDRFLMQTLHRLFDGAVPATEFAPFARLRRRAEHRVRQKLSDRADAVRSELVAEGVVDESERQPLQLTACEFLLDAEIDHVLIGMRDVTYVRDLDRLFARRASV